MAGILSQVPVVNRLLGLYSNRQAINVPSVEIHHIETDPDKRARCLKHLIKANHANYSIVYHNLQYDNHNAHILSSAYLLGASVSQLNDIYDKEIKELDAWVPSPAEIGEDDWQQLRGDKRYQRAFVDFFEDKFVMRFKYDWRQEMEHYLFTGDKPLFHGLIGGLGHPLIHLGYAFEMDCKELAMEALGLACVQYNFFHKYFDNQAYTKQAPFTSASPLELLTKLSKDSRFDSISPELDDMEELFNKHEDIILEYWNAWEINDPLKQFELSQEAAAALLVATVKPGTHAFNFLLVHLLTTSHAVRILLPFIPEKYHITLVREWWLLVLGIFIVKGRPLPDPDNVDSDLKQRGWKYVEDKALNSDWATDAHYVKASDDSVFNNNIASSSSLLPEPAKFDNPTCPTRSRNLPYRYDTYANTPSALMAPPAKRRRRNVVEASDDEDEQPRANTLNKFLISSPSSPTKTRVPTASPSPTKPKILNNKPANNGSLRLPRRAHQSQRNSTSPSTKRTKDVGKAADKGKTADLKTLFSNQAQRAAKTGASDRRSVPLDDIISDPISEDDDISEQKASSSSLVGQHAKKRLRNDSQPPFPTPPLSASQKFIKPPKQTPLATANDDSRPWSERFGPRNLEELAVHKKKVSDVRRWLEDVIGGRMRQRLLILKGAAGSGKTTTMRLLANDMGSELLEWRNPTGSSGLGFVSASAQFEEFLGRGGKFGALDTDDPVPTPSQSSSQAVRKNDSKRIILIEEFPNTFQRSSTALTSFRNTILQYLAANTPSLSTFGKPSQQEPVTPVVMIISETHLTTTSASADSFTAHRLLGPEILQHPGVGMIEFNAIAPSLLLKALELIVQKEARKSGRRKTPGPLVLKRLGEIGDIRNAASSLEFLCLKGDQQGDWGNKVAFSKQSKGVKDSIKLTQGEEESLELISQREASLGIFHAVGKVVYNKRDEFAPRDDTTERLPGFLSQHSRPKRSEVNVDALIDETGTDTHTFVSALHENYVLSCESTDPMDLSTPMDYINDCIEYLSQADLLSPSRDIFFGGRGGFSGPDSGSHVLRQDEITFQVAVRGMLFSLPNPVKRKSSSMSKGSDAFKMFYPTSLKLWRAKEELESFVDMWSTKLLKGDDGATKNLTDGATAFRRPQQSSDDISWMQRKQQNRQAALSQQKQEEDEPDNAPLLSLGSAARREMLLERLPYMTHIARARKTSTFRLRDLEKVVAFKGINAPDDESDADDDMPLGEAWATDKPSEEMSPRKKRAGVKDGNVTGLLAQKLVLSDDDIED
ncbi:cell cycle checkpoint protein rad17 [Fusarium flagelliforme]|uniref:Cell cycle checkpoint protein rad17 n=2 Tax=Fusarium flagelliforme TaxID=2675880 RepID=A0A395MZN0_9HYPO|nr:cell cycle checkpoint protein rad17 [Fusarium flagelliforme]